MAGLGFVFGYVSYGITTGDWGWDAVKSGGITAGASWLTYNTAGATSSFLVKEGVSKGTAAVLGNAVGGAAESFAGNVAGQAWLTGSVDMGQAGKAALYGLGYGVGSGLVDASPLFAKHFPMNHTVKYLSRSIAGELLGSSLTGNFSSMTFGLNPGLAIPVLSDVASLTSPYWTSSIAQKKLNESIRNTNEGDVGITTDIKLRSTLVYGYCTDDSGYWIARSNDGNY